MKCQKGLLLILICMLSILNFESVTAQELDSSNGRNLYHPHKEAKGPADTIPVVQETIDSLTPAQKDSILARERFVQDSIAARVQFVRDSILAREMFVRDSIARRKRIIDSLQFLRAELPSLLRASSQILSKQIIISDTPILVKNDSILTDYTFTSLIFGYNKPYTPWKETLKLSEGKLDITVDTVTKMIKSIKAPGFYHFYKYDKLQRVVRIESKSVLVSKNNLKYFRSPVDSVFFNNKGKVIKVKQYYQYYEASPNFRRGKLKFTDKVFVKQFKYSNTGNIAEVEYVKICERGDINRKAGEVCNIITYSISNQGMVFTVEKSTDPRNVYADGTFVFEFVDNYRLKSVAFVNLKKDENRKTYIEVNEDGNVSRYVYEMSGKIHQTLLVVYPDNPRAKYKFETISCSFEDDGISYYQVNNRTKKARTRDKLTMEWSDWE